MKTILFDLDGTLLSMQPEKFPLFFGDYVQAITDYCAHFADPQLFTQTLLAATKLMLKNEGSSTNEDLFMSHFLPALNLKKEEVYPLLENFYRTEFKKLKKHTEPTEIAGQLVQEALDRGWQVVLATNPVFPRLAVDERMEWAGVRDYPWRYITSYERSRACKPNLLYYRDLIAELNIEPQDCWMIGNDRDEDLVAGRLGFNTFLVTDECIGEGAKSPSPSAQGSRQELLHYMRDHF